MIIAVGGATATGKSELGLEIAKRYGGEIVSADSMQIYKEMDIGTAKITREEMQGVPHHMIDVVSPKDPYNVATYVEDAGKVIADIEKRNKVPVLVGGTGLYVRSLLYNYSHGAFDETLRKELEEEASRKGADAMWEKLNEVDPEAARKIHKNNAKRVLRALEVYYLTGGSISMVEQTEPKPHVLFCLTSERNLLYERIDGRVEKMFDRGLVDEVKRLIEEGVDFSMQSMQAIGYKEFREYFSGAQTLDETKERIKLNTRHYAKRQETWFRGMETAKWQKIGETSGIFELLDNTILK